jgi:serine O-acetyltransferase
VVVRDVPAGGTAVGIPARIVEDRSEIDREVKAGQMGFSAYAVTRAEDDPLAQAIHGLLDHAVETDRRIEVLLKTMERAGYRWKTMSLPPISSIPTICRK